MKIGIKVDQFIKLKASISANEKTHNEKQAKLKAKASELEISIIKIFKADKITEAGGKNGKVTFKTDSMAGCKNWEKFYKKIVKENMFFLLQKRLSNAAFRELLASKDITRIKFKKEFGVEFFDKETLLVGKKRGVK